MTPYLKPVKCNLLFFAHNNLLYVCQECIQALSMQNSELRTLLVHQAGNDSGSSSGDDTLSHKDEMLATLSASVKQLELERDQLLVQLKHQEQRGRGKHSSERNVAGESFLRAFYDEEGSGLLSCLIYVALPVNAKVKQSHYRP
jgi:hypothetical protein